MLAFDPRLSWDDEYKLLRIVPKLPIPNHGNILENTGKLFWYWALAKETPDFFYKTVVDGLQLFDNIIPRSLYKGTGPLAGDPPEVWQEGQSGLWIRPPSHAQAWYILVGLRLLYERTGYNPAQYKYQTFLRQIEKDNFKIKYKGRVAEDGDFIEPLWGIPVGVQYLMGLALGAPHCKFALATLNIWSSLARKYKLAKYDWSDDNNISMVLWYIRHRDPDKHNRKRYDEWEKHQSETRAVIAARYGANKPGTPDFIKNDLNYNLRLLMATSI